MTNSNWLNSAEAAAYLGVHIVTLQHYCRRGRLEHGAVGGHYRFRREDLDKFIMAKVAA